MFTIYSKSVIYSYEYNITLYYIRLPGQDGRAEGPTHRKTPKSQLTDEQPSIKKD